MSASQTGESARNQETSAASTTASELVAAARDVAVPPASAVASSIPAITARGKPIMTNSAWYPVN